jgi:DNA polymerase delta subunit 1
MFSNWFDPKALEEEKKRVEQAGEFDTLYEQLEGIHIEDEQEDEQNIEQKIEEQKEKQRQRKNDPNRKVPILDGNYLKGRPCTWKRPVPLTNLNIQDTDFVFQHVDTTQGLDKLRGTSSIHIWGCTPQGHSVAVIDDSFKPYFYAKIQNEADAQHVKERLTALLSSLNRKGDCRVEKIEMVKKLSVCGWSEDRPPETMYKITLSNCSGVNRARKALDYANRSVVPNNYPIPTYEANVQFELRYMVDHNMGGCQWIKLRKGSFKRVFESHKKTNADYEFRSSSIETIPIKDRGDIAPVRILSFDIECKKLRGGNGFVKAEQDPVICICVELEVYGTGTIHRAAFCYVEHVHQKVDPIPFDSSKGEIPVDVFVYHFEEDMFMGFAQYVRECDPDAFTGWNISKFDFPYLFKRAAVLGIDQLFLRFTRMQNTSLKIRETVIQSKAFGMKKMVETTCEGRFVYDAMDFMTFGQSEKFRSYSLNAMSKNLLGDEKVDVHFTQIRPLHEGSDKDRARLLYYCSVDAQLPLKILQARMGLVNGVEQARVTGIPIRWILGGQGRKTFSNLLRFKKAFEVVPTRSPKMNTVFTMGGYVRKPIVGHYIRPLVTQDFASLYPSIMQAFNICYTTVTSAARANELIRQGKYTKEDFNWPPTHGKDFCFVTPKIRMGILPDLLTQLLGQRAFVKGLMKKLDKNKPEDRQLYDVLDNRQLALKLCCNSVYGFLKAFILVDPRLMSAVTDWGQDMIKETANIVVTHYKDNVIVDRKACEKLGIDFEYQPKEGEIDPRPTMTYTPRIIYGDTDSIMVDFGDIGLQDVVRLQKEAAKLCTAKMREPNKLEPESVKLRSVFLAPKMYASLEILTGDVKPTDTLADACKRAKISCKGLLSKRRDNALVGSENQHDALEFILKHNDIQGAVDLVKRNIADILMDRVDLSKLVISKGLSKTDAEYKKGGTTQLHTALKERMEARAKTTGELVPETGDRVPFIMRARGKNEQASDCSEDPLYAQKNRIPVDKTYYIEKQIMAGTLKLFTAIWEPECVGDVKSSMSNKAMRTLRAYQELFSPSLPHMLQKKERKIGDTQGIEAFTVVLPQCLYIGCGVSLSDFSRGKSKILCDIHLDHYDEAKSLLESHKEDLERVHKDAWARCRKCAGGGFDEVTCANTTCDNYFHRDRAGMDIEDLEKDMVLFSKEKKRDTGFKVKAPVMSLRYDEEEEKEGKEKREEPTQKKRFKNSDIKSFFKK